MPTVTTRADRLRAAAYGLAFHVVAVAAIAATASAKGLTPPDGFYPVAIPAALVAAAVVYATFGASYLARRRTGKGAVLVDSAVGMLAEVMVVGLAAALMAVVMALAGPAQGGMGVAQAAATNTLLFALWAYGGFTVQIITVGNAAGLIGWLLLEKVKRRR